MIAKTAAMETKTAVPTNQRICSCVSLLTIKRKGLRRLGESDTRPYYSKEEEKGGNLKIVDFTVQNDPYLLFLFALGGFLILQKLVFHGVYEREPGGFD